MKGRLGGGDIEGVFGVPGGEVLFQGGLIF